MTKAKTKKCSRKLIKNTSFFLNEKRLKGNEKKIKTQLKKVPIEIQILRASTILIACNISY